MTMKLLVLVLFFLVAGVNAPDDVLEAWSASMNTLETIASDVEPPLSVHWMWFSIVFGIFGLPICSSLSLGSRFVAAWGYLVRWLKSLNDGGRQLPVWQRRLAAVVVWIDGVLQPFQARGSEVSCSQS